MYTGANNNPEFSIKVALKKNICDGGDFNSVGNNKIFKKFVIEKKDEVVIESWGSGEFCLNYNDLDTETSSN